MNTKEPLTKQWKDQLTADKVQPTKYKGRIVTLQVIGRSVLLTSCLDQVELLN